MVKHPDLAKGHLKTSDARNKSNSLWKCLSDDLNAGGPPFRDINGWKKVFADYKNHVKTKIRRNKKSMSGTGGGPSLYCSLTPLEQQLAELLSMAESVSGMPGTSRFGARTYKNTATTNGSNHANVGDTSKEDEIIKQITSQISDEPVSDSPEEYVEETSTNTPRRTSSRQGVANKNDLLQKQVDNQIVYQQNTMKILAENSDNQKNTLQMFSEINQNIVCTNKYLKRSSDIKERSYKLKKEKFEFKKKIEFEKTKQKVEQLNQKKRIFELECEKSGLGN